MQPAQSADELVRTDPPEKRIEHALSRLVRWSLGQDVAAHVLARTGAALTVPDAWALSWVVEHGPIRLAGSAVDRAARRRAPL